MNVYEVRPDPNPYKYLTVDRRGYKSEKAYDAAWEGLKFLGEPKKPWHPAKMYFSQPMKPDPDFWMLEVSSDAFAVGPRAAETVYPFLEMAGQVLPLPVKDRELLICNVLQVYDCIDPERSEWNKAADGTRLSLRQPSFVPEHMEISSLFKIPERLLTIYCWEETRDIEDEFKACVEKHKFKGLKFVLIWSDVKKKKRKR